MRNEWFDDKFSQFTRCVANFLIFAHAIVYPFFHIVQFFIDRNQT